MILESAEFQHMWEVVCCNPSHTKCLILEPQTHRSRLRNHLKPWPVNTHNKKHFVCSKTAKQLSPCGPEIRPKSTEIQAWTPRYPFLCSEVPLDRSMASMPNHIFWAPKLTTSAPQIIVNCRPCDIETAFRHQRTSTNFRREIRKRIQQTTNPSSGELVGGWCRGGVGILRDRGIPLLEMKNSNDKTKNVKFPVSNFHSFIIPNCPTPAFQNYWNVHFKQVFIFYIIRFPRLTCSNMSWVFLDF